MWRARTSPALTQSAERAFPRPRSRVGSQEIAELLLDRKELKMDHTNAMGWTALVEACRNGHLVRRRAPPSTIVA